MGIDGQGKTFLVIEDSADDALLIRRAFASVGSCRAFICRNISEGKAYIQGAGMYGNRIEFPFPNAVLCDLWLAGESGNTFLRWLKGTKGFSNLPVYVLTGSNFDTDILAAKKLGAADVFRKPADFLQLRTMLANLAGKLCG
jgi:CheY-like chemotaxis protein